MAAIFCDNRRSDGQLRERESGNKEAYAFIRGDLSADVACVLRLQQLDQLHRQGLVSPILDMYPVLNPPTMHKDELYRLANTTRYNPPWSSP